MKNLREKLAARVVLLDKAGRVAILYVARHGYYKIPGGGVEQGESFTDAAIRETLEEAGSDCEIVAELGGPVVTDLPDWQLRDTSRGFIAKATGEQKSVDLDDWEKERGFELVWAKNIDSAIDLFKGNAVENADQNALQGRDLGFLEKAKATLDSE